MVIAYSLGLNRCGLANITVASTLSQPKKLHWKLIMNLSVVGKTSGVYKQTTENAPEIPNFAIMLNVILAGMRDVSPVHVTVNMLKLIGVQTGVSLTQRRVVSLSSGVLKRPSLRKRLTPLRIKFLSSFIWKLYILVHYYAYCVNVKPTN